MSEHTNNGHESVSDWTVGTLYLHIVSILEERNLRYMTKFEAAQTAVDKAEETLKQWKLTTNEWRGAMQDKDRLLMSRQEITSELNALRASLGTIRNLSLSAILVCCSVITVILLIVRPHL